MYREPCIQPDEPYENIKYILDEEEMEIISDRIWSYRNEIDALEKKIVALEELTALSKQAKAINAEVVFYASQGAKEEFVEILKKHVIDGIPTDALPLIGGCTREGLKNAIRRMIDVGAHGYWESRLPF